MKTLIITLAVFTLALIIGCQENLVNEPVTILDKRDIPSNSEITPPPTCNTIKICCFVEDPLSGLCNLNGCVNYTHQEINRAMNPLGLHEIAIHLEMNSVLCDPLGMVHPEWRVEGRSDDVVYVSEEGIALVYKDYPITNRNDVVLVVRYMVTTDGVGISDISIAEIEQ